MERGGVLIIGIKRGLCTTFAALCLSSFVGRWIDNAPSRIHTLLTTISANRASVLFACLGWIFLVPGPITSPSSSAAAADLLPGLIRRSFDYLDLNNSAPAPNNKNKIDAESDSRMRTWIFAMVIGLGICENLSGIGNMIAMEREWVPILATTTTGTVHPQSSGGGSDDRPTKTPKQSSYTLTHLNAVTRRIDLLCKLFAPVFISLIILSSSMFVGVVVIGCMSSVSWGIEMWCARRVWRTNPILQRPKVFCTVSSSASSSSSFRAADEKWSWRNWIPSGVYSRQRSQLEAFFATDIWMPALSLTMLHFSVLAYAATFITFLLNSGFSLFLITSARVVSGIVEVSSTIVAPLSIRYLALATAAVATPGLRRGGGNKKNLMMEMKNGLSGEGDEGEEDDGDDEHQGFLLLAQDEQGEEDEEGCRRGRGRHQRAHLVGLARSGLWGINLQLGCLVSFFSSLPPVPHTS